MLNKGGYHNYGIILDLVKKFGDISKAAPRVAEWARGGVEAALNSRGEGVYFAP